MDHPIPFGPYVLLERISAGGMAEVFRARERGREGFERTVAIKKILPHVAADPTLAEMFREEARIAAALTHGNIVQVFGSGKEAGSAYIAMEYVRGRDLRAVLKACEYRDAALSISQACGIVLKVAAALEYAYRKVDRQRGPLGLVHRDISPGNILIGFDGDVKLIDFGVAWVAGRIAEPMDGTLHGKRGYASPEQRAGELVDARSDVYSLGVVLYELLTGERLFPPPAEAERGQPDRDALAIPSPRDRRPEIPASLEALVLRALAPRPEQRFADVSAFAAALRQGIDDERLLGRRGDLAQWMRRTFASAIEHEARRDRPAGAPPPPPESRSKPARKRRNPFWLPNGGVTSPGSTRRQTLVLTSNRRAVAAARKPRRGAGSEPPAPARPRAAEPTLQIGAEDIEWDADELETHAFNLASFAEPSAPRSSPQSSATAPAGALEGSSVEAGRTTPGGGPAEGRSAPAGLLDGLFAAAEGRSAPAGMRDGFAAAEGRSAPAGMLDGFAAAEGRSAPAGLRDGFGSRTVGRSAPAGLRDGSLAAGRPTWAGATAEAPTLVEAPQLGLELVPRGPWTTRRVGGLVEEGWSAGDEARSPFARSPSPRVIAPFDAQPSPRMRLQREPQLRAEALPPTPTDANVERAIPSALGPEPSLEIRRSSSVGRTLGLVLVASALGAAGWFGLRARGEVTPAPVSAAAVAPAPEVRVIAAAEVPPAVPAVPVEAPASPEARPDAVDDAHVAAAGPPSASEPTEASTSAKPRARAKSKAASPTQGTVEKSATLRIATVSGVAPAQVRVDGEYIGKTPKARVAVTPGRHTITYRWPDGRQVRKTVQVAEGATKTVEGG